MNKPFSSLPVWQVLLIGFGIAITAGLLIKLLIVENVITGTDGAEYLHPSFLKPLTKEQATKIAAGSAKKEEKK